MSKKDEPPPEGPEIRIMSEFINQSSDNLKYKNMFHVSTGNIEKIDRVIEEFSIISNSNGKELSLILKNEEKEMEISVFMGMSGNWKLTPTTSWRSTKFTRLKFDSVGGKSLILYGGYMGPKYKIGKFTGEKRGPDAVKDHLNFKNNIMSNLEKKDFDKPICETLLNQKYFNGVGNYLRSTILFYMNENPFLESRSYIKNNPKILDLVKEVQIESYNLNGGQLRDWTNPFNKNSDDFEKWVFYKKGLSCTDKTGRTFWFDPKWETFCPFIIK